MTLWIEAAATDSQALEISLAALYVSIVATVLAAASATWSVVVWFWSGPRVRVKLHAGVDDGVQDIGVYIWNRGRAPIQILAVTLDSVPSQPGLVMLLGMSDSTLPHLLEPGTSLVVEERFGPGGSLYRAHSYEAVVELANGDRIRSRARNSTWAE